MTTKPGRNDPCACGSGKKYKKCCEAKEVESKKQRFGLFSPFQAIRGLPMASTNLTKRSIKIMQSTGGLRPAAAVIEQATESQESDSKST